MSVFRRKKLFLALPNNNGFDELFAEQLSDLGFDLTICSMNSMLQFEYHSIWIRLYNTFRKVFFNDYLYKQRLIQQFRENMIMQQLPKLSASYDYALFIRPDMFPLNLFDLIRTRTDKFVGYQWDGLNRYPVSKDRLAYFDRFFVFDPDDVSEDRLPLTNFYTCRGDFCKVSKSVSEGKKAFFIAGYERERLDFIKGIKQEFNKLGYTDKFMIFSRSTSARRQIIKSGLEYIDKIIDYREMLPLVEQADILIDVVSEDHNGLSFRTFEALGYHKKLITTNVKTRNYDFYYPENIFIWTGANQKDLQSFLETPMREVPEEIRVKYSFENWIKYVLDTGDFQPIL